MSNQTNNNQHRVEASQIALHVQPGADCLKRGVDMGRADCEKRLSGLLSEFRGDTGHEVHFAGEGAGVCIFIHENEDNRNLSPEMTIEKLLEWWKGFDAGYCFNMLSGENEIDREHSPISVHRK